MDTLEATQPKRSIFRRWVVVVIVVVAVLAIGVPYVYIHFIEGSSPKKFSLTSVGGAGATVPLDGAWSVTSGSQAGYRVEETLLGQHNTAVGRTSDVSGTIEIAGATVKTGKFVVDMASVHSDQRLRDRTYAGRLMDTAAYPTSTFTLTKAIDFSKPPGNGVPISMTATGTLTLRGVTRIVTAHLRAEHNGGTIEVVGQIPVKFSDFKISTPTFTGVAQGQDHGTVEFQLFFTHGRGNPTPTTEVTTPTTFPARGSGGPPPGGGGAPTITTSPTTVAPLQLK